MRNDSAEHNRIVRGRLDISQCRYDLLERLAEGIASAFPYVVRGLDARKELGQPAQTEERVRTPRELLRDQRKVSELVSQ